MAYKAWNHDYLTVEEKLVLLAIEHQGIVGRVADEARLREMTHLPELEFNRAMLKLIRMHLIQCRDPDDGESPISSWAYVVGDQL